MTQAKFENLSALVDGEHTDKGIVDELSSDETLASRWQSYHLIKDAMRNELPDQIQFNIADAVAEALESEPTVMAPNTSGNVDTDTVDNDNLKKGRTNKVVRPLFGNVMPLFRQGGQFAIAASVAVAVIVGYQQINYSQDSDLNIAPVKAVSGIQSGFSPVSLSHDTGMSQTDVIEQRRKLNALMADHQQQMTLKTSKDVSEEDKTEEEKQN